MTNQEQELKRHFERIIKLSDERGDFVTGDDGYVVFWPIRSNHGAIAAYELRALADELDRRNAEWDKQVQEYFDGKEEQDT